MRHVAISLVLVACAGKAPPNAGGDVDAGVDAPPPVAGKRVSGKVMDYFGAVPLPDSMIATDGIDPPQSATTSATGDWELLDVPVGSVFFLSITRLNYKTTRNIPVPVAEEDVVQDIYTMSVADHDRQYTSLGRTVTPGRSLVIAELQRNNGTPLVDVPLADIQLVDALGAPVPGVVTVFMGAVDVDAAILVSTAIDGRARVALLDVPPGAYTLNVTTLNGMGQPQILTAPIATVADGATLGKIGGDGGGGMGMPMPVVDPLFSVDVYPVFQRAALNGIGCANCHTLGGTGAILILDDGAANVLARLGAPALGGRIDTTPEASLLLTKPLYELTPPQNHPNATFLDLNNPYYKLILLWIQNGLKP